MVESVSEWIEKVRSDDELMKHPAFINDKGLTVSYEELIERSKELASALHESGIRKGDHIAVWLPNSIEWTMLEIGCGIIGATLVCLNTRYHSHELSYILKQSDSKMLFFSNNVNGRTSDKVLKEVLPELYQGQHTASFEEFPYLRRPFAFLIHSLRVHGLFKNLLQSLEQMMSLTRNLIIG